MPVVTGMLDDGAILEDMGWGEDAIIVVGKLPDMEASKVVGVNSALGEADS